MCPPGAPRNSNVALPPCYFGRTGSMSMGAGRMPGVALP